MSEKMMRVMLVELGKLVINEVEKPQPGKGEVLLKVKRCGICGSDITIYKGKHPYAKKPLVMGHEFSGIVEELAVDVDSVKIGTRVTVIPHVVCGKCKPCSTEIYNFCEELKCMGAEADGAHSDYVNVSAKMVMPIPDNMSMDDAAMVEPAAVAYHGAKRGEIRPSDKVLVIGAGPVGIFTMQSCKTLGAEKVYIADIDKWRLGLASKLGANGIINVSEESLEKGLTRLAGGTKEIDVFYDCVGEAGKVLDQILQIARRGTRIVVIGVLQKKYDIPHLPDFVQHELRLSGTTMYVPQDYREVIQLMGAGRISTKGMITHYFNLSDIKKVFKMIEEKKEPFFKIMLKYGD